MLNKLQIIGNCGSEPRIVQLRDSIIVHVSVATTEPEYMTERGQMVPERTTWHRLNIYGNMAKSAAQFLHKGSKVYAEGKLINHQFADKTTGELKDSLELDVQYLEFLTSRADSEKLTETEAEDTAPAPNTPPAEKKQKSKNETA